MRRHGYVIKHAKAKKKIKKVKERRWPLLIVVKKSYKLQVTRKGKATLEQPLLTCFNRVSFPPVISGSQIQHLRICPELLKSCICDPEIRGGGPFTVMQRGKH